MIYITKVSYICDTYILIQIVLFLVLFVLNLVQIVHLY